MKVALLYSFGMKEGYPCVSLVELEPAVGLSELFTLVLKVLWFFGAKLSN